MDGVVFTCASWQGSVTCVGIAITCLLLIDPWQSSLSLASCRLHTISTSVDLSSLCNTSFPLWKSSTISFVMQKSDPISMGVNNYSDTRNTWSTYMSPNFSVKNTCFLTVCAFRLNAPTKTTFCVGSSRLAIPCDFSSLYSCSDKIDASHPVSKTAEY